MLAKYKEIFKKFWVIFIIISAAISLGSGYIYGESQSENYATMISFGTSTAAALGILIWKFADIMYIHISGHTKPIKKSDLKEAAFEAALILFPIAVISFIIVIVWYLVLII